MYKEKILLERQEAHNANVANKILDMMDKLKLSVNSNSPRRWIWELLQNAKDVSNSSGKVKVKINLSKEKNILEFSHNGRPFSTKNIVFLIEQVSTKDRDAGHKEEKVTGKFGTGFLTTHLLSEIVTVNGYIADEHEPIKNFKVTIDRSGKNKETIIESINLAYEELDESTVAKGSQYYNPNDYNTVFTYSLDEKGKEVAETGLEDLKISIPYVMALNPKIEEVNIESENITYKVIEKLDCRLENSSIYKIEELLDGNVKYYFILLVEDQPVRVAVALEKRNEQVWIKQFDKKQPKIFCDFPLVGTDDFPFPIIVESGTFNPTEPRDGIFLTDIENGKIQENKNLILKACKLYQSLLNYASENYWYGLYNATEIKRITPKDWISTDWLKQSVVDKLKEFIKYCPIIDNAASKRIALYNETGENQVAIPNHINEQIRSSIWDLTRKWIPNELPRKEDIHHWYKSLWSECKNLDLERLTMRIEELKELEALTDSLEIEYKPESWLNEYFTLVKKEKRMIEHIVSGKYAVIPNQNGIFKLGTELSLDDNIDEDYKEILDLLGEDCKEYLLHRNVEANNFIDYEKVNNESIIRKIVEELKWASGELECKVYSRILVLHQEELNYKKQIEIQPFAVKIFGNYFQEKKYVKNISEELLDKSIKSVATQIAEKISETENINNFVNDYNFLSKSEALKWLGKFVDFLVKNDFDNLINKSTKPILPNQNGFYLTKDDLFLDDGEIDEELKSIATECGLDIRNELLDKEIFLKLPENREKHTKDLAEPIVAFVKKNEGNRINQSGEIKSIFKRIFIWIEENLDLAQKVFPELCENKHWLYDDKEIASNMKKAEIYDDLLDKYGIKDSVTLEKILQQKSTNEFNITSKETMTEDILIQSGIYTDKTLENAMNNAFFADNFTHLSESDKFKFDYVKKILERSKDNVLTYLGSKNEYDLNSMVEIDKTIFLVKKNNEEIYIITRPSDYGQVILYYESEKDILDYEKDWELWVEDGSHQPQKITFGKMLKMTGINKIPLKRVR
ncbi:ATP-binding protein [Ornithinibacillus californiensis]|uniref:ATP-binding protein n=1 Tax=Ornithinibacillus californiensis TaxID=161536 RepID=UPI00064DB3D3|nr:ATP-binding protein [Ornithinibacillus californiensis]